MPTHRMSTQVSAGQAWGSRGAGRAQRITMLTDDRRLEAALQRLCAGGDVEMVSERQATGIAGGKTAPVIVVGSDCAPALAAIGAPRDARIVLVTVDDIGDLWRYAAALRADGVFRLPDDELALTGWLANATEGDGRRALVLGFVGLRGGVGASTAAAITGLCAAQRGSTVLMIDADLPAGRLDLVLGGEDVEGIRWGDVIATRGRLSGRALQSALPRIETLAVLSGGAECPDVLSADAFGAVVEAGRRVFELLVVDLPRAALRPEETLLAPIDALVVVTTADVRSAAIGRRLADRGVGDRQVVGLAVRVRRGDAFDADDLAEAIGLPNFATIPTERRLEHAVDLGLGPVVGRRMARRVAGLADTVRRRVAVP